MGQLKMQFTRLIALGAVLAAATSCGDAVRTGSAPVVLTVNQLQAAPGGGHGANQFVSTLFSDVQVLITTPAPCTPTTPCPTIYADNGQAILGMAPKDPAIAPTAINQVTINRVHIKFVRADGRNVQGVDVPYEFDGAATGTIPANGTLTLGFELVRHAAKEEPPLVNLINSSSIITTIAQVTFYGSDLAGNQVSVMGQITVDFGNFGDQ